MLHISSLPGEVLRRADLLDRGLRPKRITRAVREGDLLRIRRDRYMAAPLAGIDQAVRVGGRLSCVSLLAALGVFVFDASRVHVHLDRTMSRLRSPHDSQRRYSAADNSATVLHWWTLRAPAASLAAVDIADALGHAVRCQSPWHAVATIDSILHMRLLSIAEVRAVFAGLPERYQVVLRMVDASAESGTETIMRLLLRALGVKYQTQVWVDGVGRVDFLVDGWLIIECDSKAHHEGWDKQRQDRRRDLAAARQGLVTLRPLAEDLLYDRDAVRAAVRGLLAARR